MNRLIIILMTCFLTGPAATHASPIGIDSNSIHAKSAIGDPIPIVEPDGSTTGSVTVTSFSDPGSAANTPGNCCEYAFAYLTLSVTTLNQPLKVDRLDIQGFDTYGIGAIPKMNDTLDMATGGIEIGQGDTASIDIQFGYQSLGISDGGTSLVRVIWARGEGSLITLVNLASPVELGAPQTLAGALAGPFDPITYATMTLLEFSDPLTKVRKSSVAPAGYRNVGIRFSVESFLDTSIGIEQLNFRILTTDNLSYSAVDEIVLLNSARHGIPQLKSRITLHPGEFYEGSLGFRLPAEAEIASVVFYLKYDGAFITLYDVPSS